MLVLALGLGLVRFWLGLAVLGIESIVLGVALSMNKPAMPDEDV